MKRRYNCLVLALVLISLSTSLNSCAPSYVAVRPGVPGYVRPRAPGPGYVWVNDNWLWRSGRYEHVPGYWAAPRRNQVWVDGSWNSGRRGYHWIPGRWRPYR